MADDPAAGTHNTISGGKHQAAAAAFIAAGDQDAADEALQNAERVRSARRE